MRTAFIRLPQMLGPIALMAFLFCSTGAKGADDQMSLTGLKDVKVAFDIKEGDAKLLLSRLDVIDETRQSLIRQGVTPHLHPGIPWTRDKAGTDGRGEDQAGRSRYGCEGR